MPKKIRKTLYLPAWLAEILDSEGSVYDGPGVVAAASINHFSEMDKKTKVSVLQNFRSKEIKLAYLRDKSTSYAVYDENVAASASAKSKRKQRLHRRVKSV